jgi:hypothetical protein
MRTYVLAGLPVVVIVTVGVLIWPGKVLLHGGNPVSAQRAGYAGLYKPGRSVPTGATATTRNLVSGSQATQRAALAPSLAAALPKGALFPVGSTIALNADSWEQTGKYANATGVLTEPGKAAVPVEIGFIDTTGTWLVTFEEALP